MRLAEPDVGVERAVRVCAPGACARMSSASERHLSARGARVSTRGAPASAVACKSSDEAARLSTWFKNQASDKAESFGRGAIDELIIHRLRLEASDQHLL